jgi:hypothetical protein
VDTGDDVRRAAGHTPAKGGRVRPVAMIVIFDVAATLAAYGLLRSAGLTAVTALLLSGVFPALGVGIGALSEAYSRGTYAASGSKQLCLPRSGIASLPKRRRGRA